MLTDSHIDGGQAIPAEIMVEVREVPKEHRQPTQEIRTFELPSSIWTAMFASYATFFTALIVAIGHDTATIFVLVICIAYTIMYFGTAAALNSVSGTERKALPPAERSGGIETQTGWMDNTAVYAQILTVPILLAVFALAVSIILVLV